MSGPNTLNPYGVIGKDIEIVAAADTVLFDNIASVLPAGYQWYADSLDLNIMQMGAGSSLIIQDDNGNVIFKTQDVVGNMHKTWDVFTKPLVGRVHCTTAGPGPFDIFLNMECAKVPTTAS